LTRATLPTRRPNRTISVEWGNHRFHVTVGLDPDTAAPTEVFFSDGMKSGTDLLHTVQDACVMVSMLLQRGETLAGVGKSLSSEGIIGAVVQAVADDQDTLTAG